MLLSVAMTRITTETTTKLKYFKKCQNSVLHVKSFETHMSFNAHIPNLEEIILKHYEINRLLFLLMSCLNAMLLQTQLCSEAMIKIVTFAFLVVSRLLIIH